MDCLDNNNSNVVRNLKHIICKAKIAEILGGKKIKVCGKILIQQMGCFNVT